MVIKARGTQHDAIVMAKGQELRTRRMPLNGHAATGFASTPDFHTPALTPYSQHAELRIELSGRGRVISTLVHIDECLDEGRVHGLAAGQ
ncbi:hypothetical protein A9G05_21245 [Pseudomonas sp. ENNP23]|nr:hypothetical protein A9G05_21245 [Pseudomonas sp. ENNP23]